MIILQVTNLRNWFSKGGLAELQQDKVAASGFAFSAKGIWETIKQNKQLDLPAHRVFFWLFGFRGHFNLNNYFSCELTSTQFDGILYLDPSVYLLLWKNCEGKSWCFGITWGTPYSFIWFLSCFLCISHNAFSCFAFCCTVGLYVYEEWSTIFSKGIQHKAGGTSRVRVDKVRHAVPINGIR